ncbi:aspartyl protease family protein [Oceanicaulis sp. MMSF_3324]|uniref:aspartyl protease family protein n=1 Tax=Oceanicaulis sp. MMSF_3324 TaxID=3046702 RepID=UPI00273D33E5|nr:aspartyl protease family protein [Oceanicaulis sp. MMSF_3324]
MSVLASLIVASLLGVQQSAPEIELRSTPLTLNNYGLYTVETSIGRQVLFSGDPEADPVPFIVDTAASHTAVPRLIAQQLVDNALISLDDIGHGLTGQFDTSLIFVDQLDFGLGPREVEVAVFEDAYGSVMSAAGLLGANAFPDEAIQIDFPSQRLTLLDSAFTNGSQDLWIRNGLIMGEANIRGVDEPVLVLVDTGATASIVNTALLEARNGSVRVGDNSVSGVSGPTAQAEMRKWFSRFQLDNLCIRLFEITVSDVYAFDHHGWSDQPAIILGMDVLKDAMITVDYATGHVAMDGTDRYACSGRRDLVSLNQ